MATLTYRTELPEVKPTTEVKDEPLTYEEVDGNFKQLNDEIEIARTEAIAFAIIFS